MTSVERRIRIIASCNYDIKGIYSDWLKEDRLAPTQHLWGIPQLEEMGFAVTICETRDNILSRLSRRFRVIGDLDLQLQILQKARTHDLIYAAHFPSIPIIGFLRRIGLLSRPIVAIAAQHPVRPRALAVAYAKFCAGGCDRLLCLSAAAMSGYQKLGVQTERLSTILWGIDSEFYCTSGSVDSKDAPDFIAAGKTHRDYKTLIDGFPFDKASLSVFGVGSGFKPEVLGEKSAMVDFSSEWMEWRAFSERVSACDAMLVPLGMDALKVPNAIGLTAVLEAAASAVPVAVTYNPYIGIDIEREGIGLWVRSNDPEAWKSAIERLISDPGAARAMGRKGRELAESTWTMGAFATRLAQEFRKLVTAKV